MKELASSCNRCSKNGFICRFIFSIVQISSLELQIAQLKECEDHIRQTHATELKRTQDRLKQEIEERESLHKQVKNHVEHNECVYSAFSMLVPNS